MTEVNVSSDNTIIIFFPFNLKNIRKSYLFGEYEVFNDCLKIFFVTKVLEVPKLKTSAYNLNQPEKEPRKVKTSKNWIYIEIINNFLTVEKIKLHGNLRKNINHQIIWIIYDAKVFSQSEVSYSDISFYNDASYFKYFKQKINQKVVSKNIKKQSCLDKLIQVTLSFVSIAVFVASGYSKKLLPITKYFNVTIHIDNYLSGFLWAFKRIREKKKLDIKVINFFLSLVLDMVLGIIFLKWLNSKVSLDSFPKLFLLTAESIVNSIKNLLNWLKGDPAGLKLNMAFNKVLALFFSFHIDIWWTFLAFLNPVIKVIFQIFLQLGLLGITFQASIIADLLALVSFHVYCIYAYAAKLYSIQISSLMSLWRLFLGRKKNPLRGKVDSCKYSPEQLFVGTLGFTILLFLLPTTLLYYVVFTCIRLSALLIGAVLMIIRHLNQLIPVYSTALWLLRSPKISSDIEIIHYNGCLQSKFLLLQAKPVTYSWWETVTYFTPDCAMKPAGFKMSDFLSSIIAGKLLFPL